MPKNDLVCVSFNWSVIKTEGQFNQNFSVPLITFGSFDQQQQNVRIQTLFQIQHPKVKKFLQCLNNLIRIQNQRGRNLKILVLPYQQQSIYVHFEELDHQKRVTESVDTRLSNNVNAQSQNKMLVPFYYSQYSPYASFYTPQPLHPQQFMLQMQSNMRLSNEIQRQEDQKVVQEENSLSIQKQISKESSKKKKSHKLNDTKNITKNFSKAIITYLIQNKDIAIKLLNQHENEEMITELKKRKNSMTNIKQLRELWVDAGDEKQRRFNKVFRIISQYFLKSQSVCYIYNSRISNIGWHLKYRQNLLRALKEPSNFKQIKDI
ncbi:hypothetical protein pb186bvf_006757 [Paramecium bursaria]